MSLLLVLLLVTLVLFALFLGGGLVAQGYLYQSPAEHLPVRALGAAVLVGSFITMWVWINKRNPDKYDTFFEFAPYERKEITEFEAIRWVSPDGSSNYRLDEAGKPAEVTVKFKRGVGAKSDKFFEEGNSDAPFQLNSTSKNGESYMTFAIRLKPGADAEPIRLDAQLVDNPRTKAKEYPDNPDQIVTFVEEKGSRYTQASRRGASAGQMSALFVPTSGSIALALLLNFAHFLVWFLAFWLILQFTRGHAFGLTVLFGLITMFAVMPLLFKPNRVATPAPETPRVAWSIRGSAAA